MPRPPKFAASGAPAPAITPVTGVGDAILEPSAPIISFTPSALLGSMPPMPVNTLPEAVLLGLPATFIASSTSGLAIGASSKIFIASEPEAV